MAVDLRREGVLRLLAWIAALARSRRDRVRQIGHVCSFNE